MQTFAFIDETFTANKKKTPFYVGRINYIIAFEMHFVYKQSFESETEL